MEKGPNSSFLAAPVGRRGLEEMTEAKGLMVSWEAKVKHAAPS